MLLMNMRIITFKAADRHNKNVVIQFLMKSALCKSIVDHNKTLVDTLIYNIDEKPHLGSLF